MIFVGSLSILVSRCQTYLVFFISFLGAITLTNIQDSLGGYSGFRDKWLDGYKIQEQKKFPWACNKTRKNHWPKINPQNLPCQIFDPKLYTWITPAAKKAHATILKGNLGYHQYTQFMKLNLSNLLLWLSFSTPKHMCQIFRK